MIVLWKKPNKLCGRQQPESMMGNSTAHFTSLHFYVLSWCAPQFSFMWCEHATAVQVG